MILAPMSGVSDRPFRRIVRRFGAGLVVSEMIASDAMLREVRDELRKAEIDADDAPAVVQLAGWDPAVMAEAARLAVDGGAAVVDINMGCPAKKVVNKLAGSALMRDETGSLLVLDHKTILSLASFAVVAVVLALHAWSDLRGRRAARAVLVVYLLLTLAYPGVKAVHSLLLG